MISHLFFHFFLFPACGKGLGINLNTGGTVIITSCRGRGRNASLLCGKKIKKRVKKWIIEEIEETGNFLTQFVPIAGSRARFPLSRLRAGPSTAGTASRSTGNSDL